MRTRELLARVRERKSVLLEEGQRIAAKVQELAELEKELQAPPSRAKRKSRSVSAVPAAALAAFAANAEPST